MVPMRLFRSRAYSAGNVACLCVFGVLFGMVFFMAQFLQTGLGYGPLGAGLRLVPGWAALTVIAPFAGTLIRRFGERLLIAAGLTVFAGALTWIALIARTGLPYADMVAPLMLAGAGVSVAIPPTQSVVMTAVAPADIGQASGTFSTLRQLGGVFGVAICAAVFAAHGGYASPAAFTGGFGAAMLTCAALALLGALAGLIIPPAAAPRPPPSPSPTPPQSAASKPSPPADARLTHPHHREQGAPTPRMNPPPPGRRGWRRSARCVVQAGPEGVVRSWAGSDGPSAVTGQPGSRPCARPAPPPGRRRPRPRSSRPSSASTSSPTRSAMTSKARRSR